MIKYAIWNKQDMILTPSGAIFTAEQWKEQYPIAALDSVTVLCAAGELNGAFFGTLGQTVERYERRGLNFSSCVTAQDKVDLINAFEAAELAKMEENARAAAEAEAEAAALAERQTAALEAIASGQSTENAAALDALLNGEV